MVPCSLLAENIFSVFRSPHLPLDTLIKKSSYSWTNQKVQLQPCLQRYVSRMTRTENFLSQFFSKFFRKPLFSTFFGTLFIISRKYFSVFRSPHLPLDTLIKKSSCSWTFLLVYKGLKLKLKRPSKNNTITVYQSLKTSAHRNPRKCRILQDTAL